MDPILAAIDAALRRKGLTDAAASRLAVGNPALIKNLRTPADHEKRYSIRALQRLADVLDLELYFGPPRSGAEPAGDFALVPLHAAELSAGPGAAADDADRVETLLAFRRDWLARMGLPPARAALARVRGDSMTPRLNPGDLVLIDTARTDPRRPMKGPEGNIFALRHQGELVVKRVEQPPDPPKTPAEDPRRHRPCPRLRELVLSPQRVPRKALEDASTEVLGLVRWWSHAAKAQP